MLLHWILFYKENNIPFHRSMVCQEFHTAWQNCILWHRISFSSAESLLVKTIGSIRYRPDVEVSIESCFGERFSEFLAYRVMHALWLIGRFVIQFRGLHEMYHKNGCESTRFSSGKTWALWLKWRHKVKWRNSSPLWNHTINMGWDKKPKMSRNVVGKGRVVHTYSEHRVKPHCYEFVKTELNW